MTRATSKSKSGRSKAAAGAATARRRAGAAARGRSHARLAIAAAGALVVALAFSAGLYFLADRTSDRDTVPEAPAAARDPVPPPAAQSVPPDPQPVPDVATAPLPPPPALPAWRRNAVASTVAPGQPMIAVVIDDMGVDQGRSRRTVALQAPLTLAYLAYARDLEAQTAAARAAGHELMVHLPMEPDSGVVDPGPNALLTGLAPEEYARRIEWNLSRFDGFVGANNHMGSRLTRDAGLMAPVMAGLKARGLLFLDSRTSGDSVAAAVAGRSGVPALGRDVFLDHVPTREAVRAALAQTEAVARRQGHAIAIGHPKDVTIEALAEWLPEARRRGFALVPVSALALKGGKPRETAAAPARD